MCVVFSLGYDKKAPRDDVEPYKIMFPGFVTACVQQSKSKPEGEGCREVLSLGLQGESRLPVR